MNELISKGVSTIIVCCCLVRSVSGNENDTIEIRTIGIPPYGIQSNTNPGGIYYEIANLIAEDAGYQSNNYFYPYARIVSELKSGQTDLTIMFKYKELEGHVVFIAPLPALKTVVVGLAGSNINSIEDLRGKTLAYLRGAKFSDVVDDNPDIRKQDTNDFVQGAEMLAFGRVDAIIGPLEPILSAVAEIENNNIALDEPFVVSERTPWVQISNKSADRLHADELKAIILDILNRGEFEAIRKKYIQ